MSVIVVVVVKPPMFYNIMQIEDEEWGGAFVDITEKTSIPNRSHVPAGHSK